MLFCPNSGSRVVDGWGVWACVCVRVEPERNRAKGLWVIYSGVNAAQWPRQPTLNDFLFFCFSFLIIRVCRVHSLIRPWLNFKTADLTLYYAKAVDDVGGVESPDRVTRVVHERHHKNGVFRSTRVASALRFYMSLVTINCCCFFYSHIKFYRFEFFLLWFLTRDFVRFFNTQVWNCA